MDIKKVCPISKNLINLFLKKTNHDFSLFFSLTKNAHKKKSSKIPEWMAYPPIITKLGN